MGTPWSLPPWLSWGGRGQGAGGGDVMGPPWGCASVPDTLAHCRDSARVHGASDGAMDRAWGRAGVPDALDTGAHCWDSARPQEAGDGVMEGCASGPVDTLGAVAHCWDSAGPQEAGDAGMDPPWGCASGPVNTLGAVGHCWDSARAPDRPLAVIPPMAFPVDCGAPRRGRQDPARSGRALRDVVDNWSARRRPVPVITLDDDRCDDVIVGDDGDVPPEEVEDLRTHLERRRKQMGDLLDLIPPPPPSLLATQVAAATTPSSCPRPSRPLPRTRTTRTTWRRLVAARAPRPKVGAGGRVPSNLKAVDIGGVAGMATVSVVQPSTTTPPPRSSPAEAAEATWPPSASADGRLVKKGVRRCGEGGVIVAVQAALLSTALSTAAALPTASAAGEVFHFEATAESNAAVASASTAAAGPSDKREADDDAEVDANTKKRAADDAAAEADAKRARRDDDDVIDLDLDKAVHLLVGSGARHVYRTARPRPLLHLADWTVLPPIPQHAVNNPLRYEPLDRVRDWDEFTRVERDFDYSCRGQGFQVTRVCRVENDRLLHEFQQRVRRLERQCGDVAVLRVYHGTRRANIHSIALRNLDRRHAGRGTNHAWWGVGVNFSPISYYASHYGDQGIYRSMMVFDVVVGRTCSVLSPPEAPLLPQDNPGTPGQRYDTNLKLDPGPQVICKFDDHQFYPAYIIDYTAPPKGHRWFPEAEYYCPWW